MTERPSETTNPLQAVVSKLAVALMQGRLGQGKGVEIPSLGLMITPQRQLQNISELSEQGLANLRRP